MFHFLLFSPFFSFRYPFFEKKLYLCIYSFISLEKIYTKKLNCKMIRKFTFAILLMSTLVAQAQVETEAEKRAKAERAAEAAREAAEKAAKARQDAVGDRPRLGSEEFLRIVEEQQRQKELAKARRERKVNKHGESDSVRWEKNQMKLHTWKYNWFVGGNLSANLAVADNITDHPPFRYFGDAMGLGVEAYVGKYISRTVALRFGVGYHNVKNRVDRETVDEAWRPTKVVRDLPEGGRELVPIYSDNGFLRFGALETYADVMFNVSGLSVVNRFKPFHVHVLLGIGMVYTGEKKLKDEGLLYTFERDEKGLLIIPNALRDGDAPDKEPYTYNGAASPENRFNKKSHVSIAGRVGLAFDYRFSKNLSANMELTATVTDDKFEGIKYDEPFDIMMKVSAGLKYHF